MLLFDEFFSRLLHLKAAPDKGVSAETYLQKSRSAISDGISPEYQPQADMQHENKGQGALGEMSDSERLRVIFDNMNYGIAVTDDKGKIQECNQRWADMLGYSIEEVKQLPAHSYTVEGDRERALKNIQLIKAGKLNDYQVRKRYIRRNGSTFWALLSVSVLRGDEDDFKGLVGIVQDISRQIEVEQAQARYQQRLNALYENPNLGVVFLNREGVIEEANQVWCNLVSEIPQNVWGKPFSLFVSDSDKKKYSLQLKLMVERGIHRYREEFRFVRRNNRFFWGDVSISLLEDAHEHSGNEGYVIVVYDVSDKYASTLQLQSECEILNDEVTQKRAQLSQSFQYLQHANEEMERVHHNRSRFISTYSHEMRTPLNAVLGFSDLLKTEKGGKLTEKQHDYVERISQGGKRLLGMVNALIDVSREEGAQLCLHQSITDLSELLKSVVDTLSDELTEQKILFRLNVDPRIPCVIADKIRISQVLMHLLRYFAQNLKMEEEVLIRAGRTIEGQIRVEIQSNGENVSFADIEHAFKDRAFSNIGLAQTLSQQEVGLLLSKRMIEIHGGKVGIEKLSAGRLVCWFELPLSRTVPKEYEQLVSLKQYRGRVLIADSDLHASQLLKDMVQLFGGEVQSVVNGTELIEAVCDDAFDLVFINIVLPGVDGLSAVKTLRGMKKNLSLPLVAVTGSSDQNVLSVCIDSGCNDVVVKPLKLEQIDVILGKYLPVCQVN